MGCALCCLFFLFYFFLFLHTSCGLLLYLFQKYIVDLSFIMALALSPDDKFPVSFPRNPKACSVHGNAFFACIDKNSEKSDPLDKDANMRALKACLVSQSVKNQLQRVLIFA